MAHIRTTLSKHKLKKASSQIKAKKVPQRKEAKSKLKSKVRRYRSQSSIDEVQIQVLGNSDLNLSPLENSRRSEVMDPQIEKLEQRL
jgi:hypothetical protein